MTTAITQRPTPTLRQPSTASPAPSLTRPQPELPATALGEDCSRSRRLFARAAHRHFPDVPLALLSCAKPAITTDLAFLVSHGYYAFESFYSSSTITGSTPPPLTPAGGDWYRDEPITLPAAQLVGRSEDEIAVALMEQYLTHFASPDADSANRLLEYRDVAVLDVDAQALGALARENDATFARGLTYSVRPFALELNVWIAGNGDIDNASGWVTSKTLFVAITLSGDDYVFEPLGTGQGGTCDYLKSSRRL